MDFEFSEEQEMLRTSVRAFLAAKAPISYVRETHDGLRASYDGSDEVWTGLCDLGVLGLLVPERWGGAGMGMVDAAVVVEELGRAVCPAPYVTTAIGAIPLLVDLGDARALASLMPDLLRGDRIGTVAIFEPERRYEWRRPSSTAVPNQDGTWRLDGTKTHVRDFQLDGSSGSGVVLATASDPDGVLGVYVADSAAGPEIESVDITYHASRIDLGAASQRVGGDAADAIARTLDRLGVAAVLDSVGAAQRALELSVEYAKERVQFDKPIGSFQAVQHLCADMLRTVELGRAAAYYACWAIDEASAEEAHRAATLARAFAADAFPQLGGTAIQVFGGIGFTWEHDIHLYYKRLLTQSVALGTANDYFDELARLAID